MWQIYPGCASMTNAGIFRAASARQSSNDPDVRVESIAASCARPTPALHRRTKGRSGASSAQREIRPAAVPSSDASTRNPLPMADTLTPAERSERMSRIRSQDTKPELVVRRHLHALGFRYRLHVRELPGKPDLVLPKYRAVVFVEGCFWHGHSCQKGRVPGTNPTFWQAKVETNQARDKRNQRLLRRDGWRVLRVWECQLAKKKKRAATLARLLRRIRE